MCGSAYMCNQIVSDKEHCMVSENQTCMVSEKQVLRLAHIICVRLLVNNSQRWIRWESDMQVADFAC